MLDLNPKTTALILIDLQQGILSRTLAPYPSPDVVQTGLKLTNQFRSAGSLVVFVSVGWSPDHKDALQQAVDQPNQVPPGGFPANFSKLADGLLQPGDLHIVKRQWGAFHGTEMDLQLRRRGIDTVVLGGIVTNMGVESTARQAWEHGYSVVLVENATSSWTTEMHEFAIKNIFPRISRVTTADKIRFCTA